MAALRAVNLGARFLFELAGLATAANALRLPIVIHLRTMNPEYGRRDAEIFLTQVLPRAPDVPIQIAHLAEWGGFGAETDAALSVLAEAFASSDPRVSHVYFDVSQVTALSPATANLIENARRAPSVARRSQRRFLNSPPSCAVGFTEDGCGIDCGTQPRNRLYSSEQLDTACAAMWTSCIELVRVIPSVCEPGAFF